MSKECVKYHNNLNSFSFAGFKEKELDIFFTICYKLKECGDNIVEISFNELKALTDLTKKPERLKNYILQLNKKLLALNYQMEVKKNEYEAFVFFTRLYTNFNTGKLEVSVQPQFVYLLNNLVEKYTKFDLLEFISLKSVYSKNMFKLLKQWETKKEKEFLIDDFRNILNVPPKYRISEIDKFILTPIMQELPNYFPNLKLEKIKTGKKVTSLKFSWSRKVDKIESHKINDVIDIIEISEELNKTIEKAKKNRFIQNFLTIDNIEILTQMFQENDLIKGLIWASKEIRQDISTLNYLIKTIRTGIEKKEKKLVIKKSIEKQNQENIFDKTFEEIPLNFEKIEEQNFNQKEEITDIDYEEIYLKYLEDTNTKNNPFVRKAFDIANKNKYIITNYEDKKNNYEISENIEDKRTEIILSTYQYYAQEEIYKLKAITQIDDSDLLQKMAENILNKIYKIVDFDINNPEHISEANDDIRRVFSIEADSRYNSGDLYSDLIMSGKYIKFSEIPQEKLLSKTGKRLTGGALVARLEKISKELDKVIMYKNNMIGLYDINIY